MTWNYDPTLATPRDRVRLRIGDTNEAAPLRQDETVAALIAAVGELGAIEVLATSLAAEYAQRPDSLGDNGQSISWSRRVTTWLEVAALARKEMGALEGGDGDGVSSTLSTMRPVRSDVVLVAEYVRERPDAAVWWLP